MKGLSDQTAVIRILKNRKSVVCGAGGSIGGVALALFYEQELFEFSGCIKKTSRLGQRTIRSKEVAFMTRLDGNVESFGKSN